MRERKVLKQLREIRQFRERRAEEQVVRSNAEVLKAERSVTEARNAADAEMSRVSASEREAFAAVRGQTVAADNLHRLQRRFEVEAGMVEAARARQADAEKTRTIRQGDLASARKLLAKRVRSVTKLDDALKQLKVRKAGREIAREEQAFEDEGHGATPGANGVAR